MNMKDKNGNNVLIGDVVHIAGDKDDWTVMTDQDDFGDVIIKYNSTGVTLHRHPNRYKRATSLLCGQGFRSCKNK